MTMSPEEQFIQETWKLLQQIRLNELANPNRMSAIVQSKTGRRGFEVYIDDLADYILAGTPNIRHLVASGILGERRTNVCPREHQPPVQRLSLRCCVS